MSKITLDAELKARLNGLNEQLEICDESGQTLGQFLPQEVYRTLLIAWSKAAVSDEELAELRKEPRGRTLKEIWKDLQDS